MCGLHQCPCCDYFTLPERTDWDICPVCFWEDDVLPDGDWIDQSSPANRGMTPREARANFRRLGACNAVMLPHVCPIEERGRYRHKPRNIHRTG